MAKEGVNEAEVEALEWPVDSSGETGAALVIHTSRESSLEEGEVEAWKTCRNTCRNEETLSLLGQKTHSQKIVALGTVC
jgi:hypothetical protein